MNIDSLVNNLTPELFERLQYGASTGKWPDGTALTEAQKEQTVQLVMLYQAKVAKTNEQFTNYDFGNMSQAIYDFWYKDLADNYLEACKPAMSGDDEEAKKAVRNTLFLCLDSALRLLHPTMPYITEELYQRLPDRANAPESIVIAEFPESCMSFADEGVEETFEILQDIVKKCRS